MPGETHQPTMSLDWDSLQQRVASVSDGLAGQRREHVRHAEAPPVVARRGGVRQHAVDHGQLEDQKGEGEPCVERAREEERHAEVPGPEILLEDLLHLLPVLDLARPGRLAVGAKVRDVRVDEEEEEDAAHREAEEVPEQEAVQAAAARAVPAQAAPAAAEPAAPVPAAAPPLALDVGVRMCAHGQVRRRPPAVGHGPLLLVLAREVSEARAAHAAGQAEEGHPDQHAAAEEVHEAAHEVVFGAGACHAAGVVLVGVHAHVVLVGGHDRHPGAAGDDLRALEGQDKGDELVLVGRGTPEYARQHHGEEGDADAEHGHHGEHQAHKEQRVLQLAEDRVVEG
mmetsp:Transcript_44995/g.143340  ORF Transcript_44995/g.143340 Transcript_44995/m.143340 type:complete len:340 (+) Transcript_44995:77-1096(+)